MHGRAAAGRRSRRARAGTLSGRSRERLELVATPIPLELRISTLACRGGEAFLRQLFEPLGYEVEAEQHLLDRENPEWGSEPLLHRHAAWHAPLADALSHLYVLVPYWTTKNTTGWETMR